MKTIVRRVGRLLLLTPMIYLISTADAAPSRDQNPRGGWTGSRRIEFQTLDSGLYGPWTRPALILIRNPTEWHGAMIKAGATVPVPPPRIDWSNYAVVLAALGQQPFLGYSIEVTQAFRHAQDLLLKVNIELPDVPNPTQNFTFPYHIVQVQTWKSMGVRAEFNAVVPNLDTEQTRPKTGGRGSTDALVDGGRTVHGTTWGALKDRFHQ